MRAQALSLIVCSFFIPLISGCATSSSADSENTAQNAYDAVKFLPDRISHQYINETEVSLYLPVETMVPQRSPTAHKANALDVIGLGKHAPLEVVSRRNGTFLITEGNSKYDKLKKMGAKKIPAVLVEPVKGAKYKDQLQLNAKSEEFILDSAAQDLIAQSSNSVNLPLSVLRTVAGSADAQKDKSGKYLPLEVVNRSDGTFTIIRGTDAFKALKKAGAANAPVVLISPYTRLASSYEDLMKKTSDAKKEFARRANEIHSAIGGKMTIVEGREKDTKSITTRFASHLKGSDQGVGNILRARFVFDKISDVMEALDYLKNRKDVIRYMDRMTTPSNTGHRDVFCYMMLSNGVVGDIQVYHSWTEEIQKINYNMYRFYNAHENDSSYAQILPRVAAIMNKVSTLGFSIQGYQAAEVKRSLEGHAVNLEATTDKATAEKILKKMERLLEMVVL